MFNNDYENYMRTVLGYPVNDTYNIYDNNRQIYNNNPMYNNNSYFPYRATNVNYNRYEEFYPEIYKILKPMVKKICDTPNRANFSDDILNNMTDEIYDNIEQDIDVINVNINTVQEAEQNKGNNNSRNSFKVSKSSDSNEISNEEKRQKCCSNPTLKDLIKIMIIQELLQNNRPPRPPMPGTNPGFNPRPPYRELESPDIYSNNYVQNQHPFYN